MTLNKDIQIRVLQTAIDKLKEEYNISHEKMNDIITESALEVKNKIFENDTDK